MNINLVRPSKVKKKKNDYLLLMMQYGFISLINNITKPSSNTCINHVGICSIHKTKSKKNVLLIISQLNIILFTI